MEFENSRKYQKLTKTDKYTWSKKGRKCKYIIPELNKYDFFICIYNVIKFFFKKFKKICIKTIDIRE